MKIVIALSALVLANGMAIAETAVSNDPPTHRVDISDLDLSKLHHQKILRNRIGIAVDMLCRETTGSSPVYYAQVDCRKFAWKGVNPQFEQAVSNAHQVAAGSPNLAASVITISSSD